jgi:uncharacterized 2Fe-2S/4Fe-4S cluster protein (DUF4445 family)
LRLAKAGSALNQQTLMAKYGIDLHGLGRIYLASRFGNDVDLDSAAESGMLPNRENKLAKIGNGALTGARQMLLCRQRRADAEWIVPRIEHVKLSEEKDFLDRYIEQLYFRRWP